MQMHASCAARHGQGVLVLGPAGSGKSSLILRLISAGFMLVADDRVCVTAGVAEGPGQLTGLLEVRGVGILRLPYLRRVPLRLVVHLGSVVTHEFGCRDSVLGLKQISVSGSVSTATVTAALSSDWSAEREA